MAGLGRSSDDGSPAQARGLAWIDPAPGPGPAGRARAKLEPSRITGLALDRPRRRPPESIASRSSKSRVLRFASTPRSIPLESTLTLDGTLTIVAGTNALLSDSDLDREARRLAGIAGLRRSRRRPVCRRPAWSTSRSRAALGLPEEGQALLLSAKIGSRAEKTIHFHAEYPWTSGGQVPIVAVSRKYLQQGTIVVKTPADGAVSVQDFRASHSRCIRRSIGEARSGSRCRIAGPRRAMPDQYGMDIHAFAFNEPGARLEVSSEPLEPMREAGVVREAVLSTSIDPNWPALNRLRLLVHCGEARSLDLVLPAGMSLARVRRDGTDVTPIDSGRGLKIPLPGASQGSRLSTIVLDYVTSDDGLAQRAAACEPCFRRFRFPAFRSRGT